MLQNGSFCLPSVLGSQGTPAGAEGKRLGRQLLLPGTCFHVLAVALGTASLDRPALSQEIIQTPPFGPLPGEHLQELKTGRTRVPAGTRSEQRRSRRRKGANGTRARGQSSGDTGCGVSTRRAIVQPREARSTDARQRAGEVTARRGRDAGGEVAPRGCVYAKHPEQVNPQR